MAKQILVVGDIMVDRSWLVQPSDTVTSQHHGGVSPLRLVDRRASTSMLGGAGTVARRLLARGATVVLAGGWSDRLEDVIRRGLKDLIPEDISDRLTCLWIARTPFETEKFRVYEAPPRRRACLEAPVRSGSPI